MPPPPPYSGPEWTKKIPGIYKSQWQMTGKIADAAAKKAPAILGSAAGRFGMRALPVVGSVVAGAAAIRDLQAGNIVGGALNLVGTIPGPIGWIGLAAATAWDATHGGGTSGCGEWDAPDGTHTHMLPAAAVEVAKVADADAALTELQRKIFGFTDGPQGTVWGQHPPEALRLDGTEVRAATDSWLRGIADVFAQIDRQLQSSGEPYMLRARSQLQQHFAAMAKLSSQSAAIMAQLAAASDAASDGYDAVTQTNAQIRRQLASGSITDTAPAHTLDTAVKQLVTQSKTANEKLAQLFAHAPVAALAPGGATLAGGRKPAVPAPKPTMPAMPTVPTPTAPVEAKPAEKSDIDKLLSGLKQQMPAMPQMPHMGGGSPMGGGTPMGHGGGSPLGGGGGTPLAAPGKRLADDADRGRKLVDGDEKKAKLSGGDPVQQKAAAVPGAAAATGPAAGLGKTGAKPAVAELKTPTEVDVKGHKVSFPDAKTAKLAQLLAAADPAHPLPLSDAAAQAGLVAPTPGQDPGQQVAPSDAKPGDVLVAGDHRYLMLGDGQFYDLDAYKVVGASELPKDMGSRAGYFHLLDPAAGGAATGPVSGQAPANVEYPVPGGTASTGVPADASPSGVNSSGTPGVPAQGGAGPASAAATDTGLREQVPSATPQNLDPKAVK
ncbi:hypothetical protein [Mycolicibacter virginiensis]|uniref:hypothetical protein n=1 Tax=Mycolicibacter virginiensis TaxID=1795032 RepID=UPI0010571153|nr:hypothetical protein [Mycolicibacter virginiensis]